MKLSNHSTLRPFQPSGFRLSGFFLAAFSLQAFSLFSALHAQNPVFTSTVTMGANQFRTSLAGGVCYTPLGSGTYYTVSGSWNFPAGMVFTNTGASTQAEAAVYVQGDGTAGSAIFTGSDVTILGSGVSGNARRAMQITNGGIVSLTGSSVIRQDNPAASGVTGVVYLSGGSRLIGSDLLIEAVGPQMTAIVMTSNVNLNTIILERTLVQNSGSIAAIRMEGSGVALLTSSTINTTGAVAPGLILAGAGQARFSLIEGLIHTTGANSPGLWLGSGNVATSFGNYVMRLEGNFANALIRADAGVGIEINTDLPGLQSRPSLANPTPTWAGNYDITVVSSTISGALGAVRMTSHAVDGALSAEINTKLRLQLQDSALAGDIFVNDGAQFILIGADSRLDGTLRLSGSAPVASVTLADSAINGGIVLSGGAALDFSADNTAITGTLAAGGNSAAKVRLTGSSTIGGIALDDFATLELTMDNTSDILGDFSIRGGATYTLLPADNLSLVFSKPLTIATGGNLRVAPGTNLTLTSPLTFADDEAGVILTDARGDDLVLAAGLVGNGRLVVESLHAEVLGLPEFRVVRDDTGALAPNAFKLAAPASNRLFAYHALENRPDGAWLTGGGFSSIGAAILDTPALAAADFYDAFSPVSRHLAALRETSSPTENRKLKTENSSGNTGAFWLSAHSGDTTASAAAPGLAFRQIASAIATGVDLRWGGGRDENTFATGFFADIGYASRDFGKDDSVTDASGRATIIGAGLYTLYQHPAGWHAAVAIRIEETKNTLESREISNPLSADYSVTTAGVTLGFGWLLQRSDHWWIEPSVEAGLARHGSAAYDTRSTNSDNRFHIAQDSATSARYRAQVALGWHLDKKWSFRARFAGSYLNISGGGITGGGVTGADFQLAGARAEAAIGFVYHLNQKNRLWVDCDTAIANGYKRPWTLAIGWSRGW